MLLWRDRSTLCDGGMFLQRDHATPWYYSRGTARRYVTAGCFCRGTTRRRGITGEGPRGPTFDIRHSTFTTCTTDAFPSVTARNSLYKVQSPGTSFSLIYTRRHISISGMTQLVAERAQLKPYGATIIMRSNFFGVALFMHLLDSNTFCCIDIIVHLFS